MAPITWRNVDAPSLGDPTRTLALAQNSINTAFDQFARPLQQMEQTNDQNWKVAKENNTNEVLNFLSGFKTVEDAQAAIDSGAVQNMMSRMGAQVDQNKVRQAQTSVIPELQQRFTQGVAYSNAKATEAEKPIVGALTALIPDVKNRKHLAQAAQQYQEAGMLRPEVVAKLLDEARSYDRNDAEWQLKLNADKRAEQQLGLQRQQLEEQRKERQRLAEQMRIGEIVQANEYRKGGVVSALGLVNEKMKNSPFTGTSTDSSEGRELIQKAVEKSGLNLFNFGTDSKNLWETLLKRDLSLPNNQRIFNDKGTEMAVYVRDANGRIQYDKDKNPIVKTIPLTAEFVANAIERTKGGDWLDPSVGDIRKTLMDLANQDPRFSEKFVGYQNDLATKKNLEAQLVQLNQEGAALVERRLRQVPPKN